MSRFARRASFTPPASRSDTPPPKHPPLGENGSLDDGRVRFIDPSEKPSDERRFVAVRSTDVMIASIAWRSGVRSVVPAA